MLVVNDVEIPCKLVLFDLDGTLIDKEFRNKALAKARYEAIEKIVGKGAANRWADLSGVDPKNFSVDVNGPLSKASRKDDIIVATTAIWLSKITWFEAKDYAVQSYTLADEIQNQKNKPKLIDGAETLLASLRASGLLLGIATNGSGKAAQSIMESIGVGDFFNVYVGADDVNEGKPAPDMILEACKRLTVDPSEAVYVGDELVDAIAGRRAGVAEVIIVSHEPDVSEYTEFVVDSVDDIFTRQD
jgi:phosphoglycolate phosphatase